MIKVYLNRKVSETQITIGNQYESGVNAIDFDLSELKEKWPNGNIYLLVSRKKHTWPYSIDDGEFKVEYVLTWKRGFYQMNVVVTDEKITDQLESSNTIFVSDTINAYVNENQINAKALNEQELPRELQIVYDDLITLKKNIEKDLADGKYIGPQGPKGEPGDVTEEYRNLASQIAQNASDAQTSATNAQVSATNAQKALDDTKDFVNQTKTELNQIKTDTRALKDEANTSAVNAQASATSAQESATNASQSATNASQSATSASQSATSAQESATNAQVSASNAQKALDDTKAFVNQTKTELNQIKTDTSELRDEANTSATSAKASEDKAKEYADNLKESTDAISQNTKAISELADKKITKFYASNQGETHVSDSDNGKIMDMMIYGQSEQKQYRGKNLLKIRDGTQTTRGVTVTAKDGVLSLKGTATEKGWALIDIDSFVLDGTYILSSNISTIDAGVANESYTNVMRQGKPATLKNAEVSKVHFNLKDGKTYDISNILVQIEKGSEATSYEPYVGGKPSPSPNYPQEIKRVVNPTIKVIGKNLWKIHGNGYINNTNGDIADSHIESYGVTDFIKMKKNIVVQSKSFDKTSNYAFAYRVGFYDSEKKWIQNIIIQTLSNPNIVDISSFHISNAEYIRVSAPNTIFDDLQIEYGTQASKYEPYKEQSIALPITLNAIPVSSGGNVTIDGQQYIADYVDVERGKVVRMCKYKKILSADIKLITSDKTMYVDTDEIWDAEGNYTLRTFGTLYSAGIANLVTVANSGWNGKGKIRIQNVQFTNVDEAKIYFDNNDVYACYPIPTPQETNLTTEQAQALKELATYYPVTNISVNSEQLDGYTVFNYPISLANGWNYVKQQLNDNRDYIYDMDLQSAEAYVNSEYAVTLTELEV